MVALAATAIRDEAATMRAIVRSRFGSPDVLALGEAEKPALEDDRVLVRVRASSVNRVDWHNLEGKPMLLRPLMMGGFRTPKSRLVGTDFAGIVEAVGKDVAGLKPGDEVFGARDGAYAEYVAARSVVLKPAGVSFEDAAAVPVAGITALQGLRDHGRLQAGQKVLINGASGGVGTYAVQIAKALGADVTAVCSTRNVDLVRSLGADRVIDYTKDDFTRGSERYDLILDVAGGKSWRACKHVLKPHANFVLVGAHADGMLLGPLGHLAAKWLGSRFSSHNVTFFVAKFNNPDLQTLGELLESGKVKSVVERRYPLSETAEAMRYLAAGHVQGKLVITV
jgi:NADPH:quinone reductase-like Zn-dependent oxidoreductase